jgi:hypothetical protein
MNIVACLSALALFQIFKSKVEIGSFLNKLYLRRLQIPKLKACLISSDQHIEHELLWSECDTFKTIFPGHSQHGVITEIRASQHNTITNEPMIPLCVPLNEAEQVQELGASWCPQKKIWFWPFKKSRSSVNRWLPLIYKENHTAPYIFPVLAPKSIGSTQLRSLLREDQWNMLANLTSERYGYGCCVCGCQGKETPVECDEIWHYTSNPNQKGKGIVKLAGLQTLCAGCYQVKHFSKAMLEGKEDEALERMSYINDWHQEQVESSVDLAFKVWAERNELDWTFDFSLLQTQGIKLEVEPIKKISFDLAAIQPKSLLMSASSKSMMIH